jgi:allantoate deiminase
VGPGAVNVIACEVAFTLDARAPEDGVRKAMVAEIEGELRTIAVRRGVSLSIEPFMDSPATAMDPWLTRAMEEGAATLGVTPLRLPSGAGHDAVAMATLCPAAMLFVRCKGGISHNPAESITEADADVAVRVLIGAVRRLAS